MRFVRAFREPELSEKVASLCRVDSWPQRPRSIEAIETHFAWIFLSERFVYKLKKPARFPDFDLTTRQARRAMCELEIALNRRLAAATYIAVVPLGRQDSRLRLECEQDPVDWLVKMHRLPAEATLERLLPEIGADDQKLSQLFAILGNFYRRAARASWSPTEYVHVLGRQCRQASARLMVPELASEHARIRAVTERQLRFAEREAALLAQRVAEGRVCDAHGDLRPEHIFLTPEPQIIDCLEFSAVLRQLDAAEEVAFLALECERLGRPDIGKALTELYAVSCGDTVPACLLAYYRSRRALVRAFLCAWHLEDGLSEALARRWLAEARWYLAQAESSIDRADERSRRTEA